MFKFMFLVLAATTLFVACGDDDSSETVEPTVTAASVRQWQSVTIIAACDDDESSATPADCAGGLSKLMINADSSWTLNNGLKTGTLSEADMSRVDSGANTLANANPANRVCDDASVEVEDDVAEELVNKAGTTLTTYTQDDRTDRICYLGAKEVSLLLHTVMTDLLAKAQATVTPTPSPSPSASPTATPSASPTATPSASPTASPTAVPL